VLLIGAKINDLGCLEWSLKLYNDALCLKTFAHGVAIYLFSVEHSVCF